MLTGTLSAVQRGSEVAKTIPFAEVTAALEEWRSGSRERTTTALLCRGLLQELANRYPGRSVEVRVPPFGAVQCIAGPDHRRGTPANVVELAPEDWIAAASGEHSWAQLSAAGKISASGTRADLGEFLPLVR